jgi:hypothetical protein
MRILIVNCAHIELRDLISSSSLKTDIVLTVDPKTAQVPGQAPFALKMAQIEPDPGGFRIGWLEPINADSRRSLPP